MPWKGSRIGQINMVDFFNAAMQAQARLSNRKNFIIIAADARAKKEINKLGKIINSGTFLGKHHRPVIKINAVELKMLKFLNDNKWTEH